MDSLGIKLSKLTMLGILIVFSILQALYNALLPIYLDEAYYWVWAMRPEFSYYDHPGMVAWIIYPFTFLANNEFTIRLSTVIAMSVTVWYLVKVSLEAFQNNENKNTTLYVFFIFIAKRKVCGYIYKYLCYIYKNKQRKEGIGWDHRSGRWLRWRIWPS